MALRIYGNRALKTVPGQQTRPTTGRVREALFNIWQGQVTGCRWLDLCAGNGVMGAEALCRQAAAVVGIERSGLACRIIRQNWAQVAQADQRYDVLQGDVLAHLPRLAGQAFDRIYFDPPYHSGLYEPVLQAIATHHLLAPTGEMAVEYTEAAWQPIAIAGLQWIESRRYGHTSLAFYRPVAPDDAAMDKGAVDNRAIVPFDDVTPPL